MMSEYISREAVRDELAKIYANATDWEERIIHRINRTVKAIPAADVAPVVHGKWIGTVDNATPMLFCSVCGSGAFEQGYRASLGTKGLAYCPYCGCKMDGADKHD